MSSRQKNKTEHIEIHRTMDFDRFELSEENRLIDRTLVRDLMKSMEKYGFLKEEPLRCESKRPNFWLWDGQHRLAAAKALKIAVWYRIQKYSPDLLIAINKGKRHWKPAAFLNHYKSRGFKDYKKLDEFIKETGFPLSAAANLLAGKTSGACRWRQNEFNEGNFKIHNEALAYRVAKIANMIRAAGFGWSRDSVVLSILARACKLSEFDESHLQIKLARMVGKYPKPPRSNGLVAEMLEDIYNHHTPASKRLYLKTEMLKAGLLKNTD
jgi:hypothetical protein